MTRLMLIAAAGVAALIAVAAVAMLTIREERAPSAAVQVAGADIGGPFELTDHTGRAVTSAELIDGPTLIYFGYTFCPDVCPVDAATMAEATGLLEQQGIEVTPVFVTIDPARDDPEALAYFVEAMHPRMVGLTGTEEQVAAAAAAYRVYYEKAAAEEGEDYLMNHSTFVYLMTPEGLQALFRRGATAEEMAEGVAEALRG